MDQKVTVLWLEDDADVIDDVMFPLKDAGYSITTVTSLKEFMDIGERHRDYSAFIIDLIVPQRNGTPFMEHPGVEAVRYLRNNLGENVPIVIFTVVQTDSTMNQLMILKVNKILYKPVRSSDLLRAMNELVKR